MLFISMKITARALKNLIREASVAGGALKERPWSLEYSFKLSGGIASDAEGKGPDGFAINLKGESGNVLRVMVDSYWNPQAGDKSGNSLKVVLNGEPVEGGETYVPVRFDDGKQQFIQISNSPTARVICISHTGDEDSPPVVYLAVPNPFEDEEELDVETEELGNGDAEVKLHRQVNLLYKFV